MTNFLLKCDAEGWYIREEISAHIDAAGNVSAEEAVKGLENQQ